MQPLGGRSFCPASSHADGTTRARRARSLSAHFGGSLVHLPPMHSSATLQQSAATLQLSYSCAQPPVGGPQVNTFGLFVGLQKPLQHSSPVLQLFASALQGS